MAWYDVFKVWTFANQDDSLTRELGNKNVQGAGITVPDIMPEIRGDGSFWGGQRKSVIKLRDTTDFIDLSSITNRISRYKEYERLRNVPEIEIAMTVFADEACVAGSTKVETPFGAIPIELLAKHKSPDEMFLVYCYDFDKNDIGLGWAFNPRKTGTKKTIKIKFTNGKELICTPDHKILTYGGEWIEAQMLKPKDKMMPFYRIHQKETTWNDNRCYPLVWSKRYWIRTEKDILDEFRTGIIKQGTHSLNVITKAFGEGFSTNEIASLMGRNKDNIKCILRKNHGLTFEQLSSIRKHKKNYFIIKSIEEHEEIDVYDLSVTNHRNFCTDSGIVHNCQIDEDDNVMKIHCKNKDVKNELETLFFHPDLININRRANSWAKNLFIYGDFFLELVIDIDDPKSGIQKVVTLPPESIFRIETVKGRVVEFQQSNVGPDYDALASGDVTQATDYDLMKSRAIRFSPEQIVHFRIGDERRQFYPYGVSLIEPARGPAHLMRLMEDAMVVYRLTRSPERRVFYIDCGTAPSFKAEMMTDRMKDLLKKNKAISSRSGIGTGASPVEERYLPPDMTDDIFIPTRPGSNTRVDPLPGGTQLGETDDVVFFRNKLFLALNFPKNYMAQEDISVTKVTLSSINAPVANHIRKLQMQFVDGLVQIARRHLSLVGFPEELYDDLKIKMTDPYPVRDYSLNEINEAKFNRAMAVVQAQFMSMYDAYTEILGYPEDKAREFVQRASAQKLMDLRLQVFQSNPELLGVVDKKQEGESIGVDSTGPSPSFDKEGEENQESPESENENELKPTEDENIPERESSPLSSPTEEDIKKYNLEIGDYGDIDAEEIDVSELDDE